MLDQKMKKVSENASKNLEEKVQKGRKFGTERVQMVKER